MNLCPVYVLLSTGLLDLRTRIGKLMEAPRRVLVVILLVYSRLGLWLNLTALLIAALN